jgi:hypothetical protein
VTSYQPLTSDDPFLGDAGALRDYTCYLRTSRDAAAKVAAGVKEVAGASEASWVGDAAQGFRVCAADGAAPLEALAERLTETVQIIGDYATALYFAQSWGRAFANQAHDAFVARRWIQQQLDAATGSVTPDPFAVTNLRMQLNAQDNEINRLRRRFDELQTDFEKGVSETRAELFKLWSLDSPLDLSGKSGELINKPKPEPKLWAYPGPVNGKGDGKKPPTEPKKSAAKRVAGSTKAKVASASSEATSFRGAKAEKQGRNFGGEAHARVSAKAKADASVSVGADGIKATAGASASAKLEVGASGSVTSKYINADASVHASVGAEAEAKATVGVGKDGLNAGIEAKVFVGGEVGTNANIDIGGIGAGGHAGVTYGIGAQFDAKAKVSLDNVSLKADLGATLGLGLHASIDIKISPKKVLKNLAGVFGP